MLTVTNCTQTKTPKKLPLIKAASLILGENYDLSLVIVGSSKIKNLNKQYRQKETAANILSFPLSKTAGEIFINKDKIKPESKKFNLTPDKYFTYLFIHGCLHLKGMTHSSKMEEKEQAIMSVLGLL
jgi:probable rRNA maturation factor